MKEIIISTYDSGWQWSIVKYEDDKYYKSSNSDDYATLYIVDKMIYDSELIHFSDENLTTERIVKKLAEMGYERIIYCEDGNVTIWENGVLEV